jgi:hypothetical protein
MRKTTETDGMTDMTSIFRSLHGRAALAALLVLPLALPASADVVQGAVSPANAKVVIKNAAGAQVGELSAGAFQLRLPAGRFTAECTAPTQKTIAFFSLAQPTTVNIDCS